MAELLVHEARRNPAGELPEHAAELDFAELGMDELLPFHELGAELDLVVEVVVRLPAADRAVGVLLLLLELGAGEVLLAAPQLVGEA